MRRNRHRQQQDAALSSNPDVAPEFRDGPSLVLNRLHPLSDLYYKKAPYKIYWGGRGSAKSWAFAEALIRLTAALPLRVLCTREFMVSIKHSSHKLLKDTIDRLGMQSWFIVTENSIRSRSGAEFIFMGLHANENGIRSMEGIDITWVEEGQTVSSASWRALTPTVRRKDGAEIWVSFNLMDEVDATYQRFVEKRRPGSIVHKVNYDSNPFFPEGLREEMETDRENDFHLYEHIWLGMPLKISNAVILSGKYVCRAFDEDLWRQADRVLYGADFGFAQDPSTLIRFFIIERDREKYLYIEHEAFGTGVEFTEMKEFYDSVPGSNSWPIKADSARPETISHLRGLGYNISAAEKWDGSVKDGIAHLRGFKQIIIHPRCQRILWEARMYRYKVDKNAVDEHGQPLVLPVVVDKNNHGWDGVRYGLDGYIQRSGAMGVWAKLGRADGPVASGANTNPALAAFAAMGLRARGQ